MVPLVKPLGREMRTVESWLTRSTESDVAAGIEHARRTQRIVQLKDRDGDVVQRGEADAGLGLDLMGLRRDHRLDGVVVDLDPLLLRREAR